MLRTKILIHSSKRISKLISNIARKFHQNYTKNGENIFIRINTTLTYPILESFDRILPTIRYTIFNQASIKKKKEEFEKQIWKFYKQILIKTRISLNTYRIFYTRSILYIHAWNKNGTVGRNTKYIFSK